MARYQDVLQAGAVSMGMRECGRRWELIEPFAPSSGIVLDVGSKLGYFGIRLALRSEDVAVVSIEANQRKAEEQARIVRSYELTRLCVINATVNSKIADEWAGTCDWFDLTLLSILDWMDDPAQAVKALSTMSARMIVEVPNPDDCGAGGRTHLEEWREPLEWARKVTGRRCTPIGRGERHMSDTASHIVLVEGPVSRRPRQAYWGSRFVHPDGNDYALLYDGARLKFSIRGNEIDYLPGVNLLSLMTLGRLVWPSPTYWNHSGTGEIRRAGDHKDPAPHNMLWTPRGLRLIDGNDRRGDAIGRSAEKVLRRNVQAWWKSRSASSFEYVARRSTLERNVASLQKRIHRRTRSLAGTVLPAAVAQKLKQIFPYR